MRTRTFILIVIMAAGLASCKEVKVGLDDSAQSTLDCLAKKDCNSETTSAADDDKTDSEKNNSSKNEDDSEDDSNDAASSGSASDSSSKGNSASDTNDSSSHSNGSATNSSPATNPADSTGGIGVLPGNQKSSNRYFMGTYELQFSYTYDSCASDYGNDYDFPGVLRAYSNGSKIDFEDSLGNLLWAAEIYPDDTFDFAVQFLDGFGRASNLVACTCTLEDNGTFYASSETMDCSCDPSYQEDDICSLTYNLL